MVPYRTVLEYRYHVLANSVPIYDKDFSTFVLSFSSKVRYRCTYYYYISDVRTIHRKMELKLASLHVKFFICIQVRIYGYNHSIIVIFLKKVYGKMYVRRDTR